MRSGVGILLGALLALVPGWPPGPNSGQPAAGPKPMSEPEGGLPASSPAGTGIAPSSGGGNWKAPKPGMDGGYEP